VYKSKDMGAWGQQPAAAAKPAETEEEKAKREALEKKCAELKKKGEPLPDECKAAELDIVFQGAMRKGGPPVKAVPQAKDSESASLGQDVKITQEVVVDDEGKVDVWEVARREPPLFPDEEEGFFFAGLHVGYSKLFGRGSDVAKAFQPVIHIAAEGAYQLFPLFQLALVADFEYMKGRSVVSEELKPYRWVDIQTGSERWRRDVGATLDDYFGFGLRPTFRFNIHFLSMFEYMAGVGIGYHYFQTSGQWRTKIKSEDANYNNPALPPEDQIMWSGGNDEAIYEFEAKDHGLYSVFETAIKVRWLDGVLGTGLLLKYSVPMHGDFVPDVKVKEGFCETTCSPVVDPPAQENDYGDTFIRHLSAMSLLTFGLIADFQF
jgi:hypothetical protein